MGQLFDRHARLFDGFVYDTVAYGRRPGCDPDLIVQGLAPLTPMERRGRDKLTDIDVELLGHKLTAIAEEARDVYMSLSISEGIITGDMNCGIFTASGDPAVVATGIYFHTLLNNAQLKYINAYYRNHHTLGLKDGDVFFFNDELGGGVHTYDMFTSTPIFHHGELVAWAEVGGHQGDTGSITPGGFAPTATSRYMEGLHVPVMRIGENFEIRQDLLDFLCNSVRNPFVFAADLKSRVATCRLIRDRVLREVERRGVEVMVAGMREILSKAELSARNRLREFNDGIFRAVLFNDDLGTEAALTRVPVTAFKEDDEVTILVQGASPENGRGPFHCTWHLMRASLAVYLFSHLFRGLPPNAGLLQPVRVLAEGPSIANSSAEMAHGQGTSISAIVVQSMHAAGSKMLFSSPYRDGVAAAHSRNLALYIFSGVNRLGYNVANFTGTANAAGQGGRFDSDGEHALGFYWGPFTDAGEVEDTDSRLPHLVLSRGIDKNYHGFGRYRGGSPLVEVATACGHFGCFMSSWGSADRLSHDPGVFGGYAGPPNPRFVIRDTDFLQQASDGASVALGNYDLLTKQEVNGTYLVDRTPRTEEHFNEGDIFVFSVGGAGGYGDVLERDPEAVHDDLASDVISKQVAEKVYGVVIDPVTGLVDPERTERRRATMRRHRLDLGKPFGEFIAEWRHQKPREEILKHYGHWPECRVEGYDKPFWGLFD